MKKMLLSAALAMTVGAAVAQDASTFRLQAEVKNLGDTLIVYKGRGEARDTILARDGKFEYAAQLGEPRQYMFAQPALFRRQPAEAIELVCVPGETATLRGDAKAGSYEWGGSKYYTQYAEAYAAASEARRGLDELEKSIDERMAQGGDRAALSKEYDEKAPALEKAMQERLLDFVRQHPDYEASATLIGQMPGLEGMEKAVDLLAEGVRSGRMKAYYQPVVDGARRRAEMEEKAKKVQAAGVEAADFTLKDLQGRDLSLSSLRGKYVVIDFWGSWCIWCIKGMPKMKEYYEKYQGKLEILGVDCRDTEAKWKAAVEKHQLPWKHVYCPKESDLLTRYAVQGFPTKIVVGPDGKIVKTIVGEDPAFYTLLDELMGK